MGYDSDVSKSPSIEIPETLYSESPQGLWGGSGVHGHHGA
jgi:hypothetical protein